MRHPLLGLIGLQADILANTRGNGSITGVLRASARIAGPDRPIVNLLSDCERFMLTVLLILLVLVVLPAACYGSWTLALRWHERRREAEAQDPRDQEVRELTATLSITRKDLARAKSNSEQTASARNELEDKLQHTSDALANTQEKYNSTKDHLRQEQKQHEDSKELVRHLQRELELAKTRITEQDMQLRLATEERVLVSDEQLLEKDEDIRRLAVIEAEAAQLRSEVARWKQLCIKLTAQVRAQNNIG